MAPKKAKQLAPIQIEKPTYPHEPGRDLPTGGRQEPGTQADLPSFVPSNTYSTGYIDANTASALIPLPHDPANTCYRNAAIVALLNILPFINYLRAVDVVRTDTNILFTHLFELSREFRNEAQRPAKQRVERVDTAIKKFWEVFTQVTPDDTLKSWADFCPPMENGPKGPKGNKKAPQKDSPTHDSGELIMYLFDRLEKFAIDPGQMDIEGGYLNVIFRKLFRFRIAPRLAFTECICGAKFRQPDEEVRQGYVFDINISGGDMTLAKGISRMLWERPDNVRKYACHICQHSQTAGTFYKLLYMPEVIIFGVNYLGPDNGLDYTSRCNYPEMLDMSELRDDPDNLPDQEATGCVYKLQSVVIYPRTGGEASGHYISYLRRSDTRWDRINDSTAHVARVRIKDILNEEGWRARLLVYVRDRSINPKKLVAGTVVIQTPQPPKPPKPHAPLYTPSPPHFTGTIMPTPPSFGSIPTPVATLFPPPLPGDPYVTPVPDSPDSPTLPPKPPKPPVIKPPVQPPMPLATPPIVEPPEPFQPTPPSRTPTPQPPSPPHRPIEPTTFQAAIPSSPNDPRIAESKDWDWETFHEEYKRGDTGIALDFPGRSRRNKDVKRLRKKFLKHFEVPRDYSIYLDSKLKKVLSELGIIPYRPLRSDKPGILKDDRQRTLTEYDALNLEIAEAAAERKRKRKRKATGNDDGEDGTKTKKNKKDNFILLDNVDFGGYSLG
ncbi:hypothetical protein BJ170DRAFT_695448 [Xylariales sp. AK1849]|nr:hypothetical protein BJ170DRAFT_695448 [Xylariales sp. AK1849]